MSETYNINMYGQPEEFLALLKNFSITIDGVGTSSVSGRINGLRAILHGQDLIEVDKLASQISGTTNSHMNHITEGLLWYFPRINALSNQKNAIHPTMSNP